MIRALVILFLLLATIAAPFVLRPRENAQITDGGKAERLVIISPHNESIMSEFSIAFSRHMRENFGREVFIDWRQPGGTSEIAMFLQSEFANAFENLWRAETGRSFDIRIRDAFTDRALDGGIDPGATDFDSRLRAALADRDLEDQLPALSREMFLRSDVGIGIDLFFGGGAYDFARQASTGTLVARDSSGNHGPAALAEEHPAWFSEDVMPEMVGGEPFRDADFRWVGTVLSAFGLCYNRDVVNRLGLDPPEQWVDLTDPRYSGQIALADPTKSGSATKAYEMLIQQRIQQVFRGMQMQARDIAAIEADAVDRGWAKAMRMILKISANGRYFTDSASKVPQDVSQGDAAAGMCIDFYGRTYNELKKKDDGTSRIVFVMPEGGTSIGADPIGMLRGAPSPELAHRFLEFVLSIEGQKLWNYRPGAPGGPVRAALRRPPIRKDMYVPGHLRHMTDADVNPYELSAGFTYRPDWTGAAFSALRFAIRCACVDTHIEQRRAWEALIGAGMPPEALAVFEDVSAIGYDRIMGEIRDTLGSKNKIEEVALARRLSSDFRTRYRTVIDLCRAAERQQVSSR